MKQSLKTILILAIFYGLVTPNLASWFNLPTMRPLNPPVLVQTQVVTKVIPAQASTVVMANVSTALSTGCKLSSTDGENLVQETGNVNLNQPANCFSLSLGGLKETVANLSVIALPAQPAVVMQKTVPQVSSPAFSQSGRSPTSFPVLPVGLVLAAAILNLEKIKLGAKKLNLQTKDFVYSPSIFQLRVMRC